MFFLFFSKFVYFMKKCENIETFFNVFLHL